MLALFSFGSAKLGRIMRLAVMGAVALGVVGIGGSVLGNPPDENGNHQHGGGDDGDADIIAPDAVTDLAAQPGALGAISLSWTAVGDDGGAVDCSGAGTAANYDIRYAGSPIITDADFDGATQVEDEPSPGSCGSTEVFCIGGLELGVSYYVVLKVEDEAGNVSALSNVASAMPGEVLGSFVHVDDIQVLSLLHRGTRRGSVMVTILDENLVPVEGATVSGQWSGCNFHDQPDSAVTDCNGLAVAQKNNACHRGEFCTIVFTVTDVAHDVPVYDPGANVETSDSTTCF